MALNKVLSVKSDEELLSSSEFDLSAPDEACCSLTTPAPSSFCGRCS